MPFYDYRCGACDGSATRRGGYDASTIPCVCGATMRRAEFNCPELIGETVPKYGAKPGAAGIKDKYGRWRLGLMQEAQAEVMHSYEKEERKPPSLYKHGLQRARQMGAPIRTS